MDLGPWCHRCTCQVSQTLSGKGGNQAFAGKNTALLSVAKGHKTPPDYSDPVFPKIPPEFYNNNKKQSAKEGPTTG